MKKIVRGVIVLFVILFLSVSCSREKNYVNVIPSDASLVTAIDILSLAGKSGISGEDATLLKEKTEQALKEELRLEETALVGKVIANPRESGINWTDKVYMFMMPGNYVTGFLASVDDKEKLEALLEVLVEQKVCGSFSEADGCRLAVSDGKFVISYNETAFLMVGVQAEREVASVKEQVVKWMNASREESYASTVGFERLQAAEGDIKLDFSMDVLPRQYAEMALAGLPEGGKLKDIRSLVGICFEKGQLDVSVENFYTDDKMEAQAERIAELNGGKTGGRFLDRFSNDVMFWANTCIDGEKLCAYLQEKPSIVMQLKSMHLPVDWRQILASVRGEVAVGISVLSRVPQVGLYAEVADEEILREFDDIRPVLEAQGFRYGVEDGVFYLTSGKGAAGKSLEDVSWAKESENKLFFFVMDMNSLKAAAPLLSASSRPAVEMITTYVESIQIYTSEVRRGHFVIKAVDKDTNILKQCIDLAKKTALN